MNFTEENFSKRTWKRITCRCSRNTMLSSSKRKTGSDPGADCNLPSSIYDLPFLRGHSSVGRAPALQAGSQGFESPCLQSPQGLEATSTIGHTIGSLAGAEFPLPPNS